MESGQNRENDLREESAGIAAQESNDITDHIVESEDKRPDRISKNIVKAKCRRFKTLTTEPAGPASLPSLSNTTLIASSRSEKPSPRQRVKIQRYVLGLIRVWRIMYRARGAWKEPKSEKWYAYARALQAYIKNLPEDPESASEEELRLVDYFIDECLTVVGWKLLIYIIKHGRTPDRWWWLFMPVIDVTDMRGGIYIDLYDKWIPALVDSTSPLDDPSDPPPTSTFVPPTTPASPDDLFLFYVGLSIALWTRIPMKSQDKDSKHPEDYRANILVAYGAVLVAQVAGLIARVFGAHLFFPDRAANNAKHYIESWPEDGRLAAPRYDPKHTYYDCARFPDGNESDSEDTKEFKSSSRKLLSQLAESVFYYSLSPGDDPAFEAAAGAVPTFHLLKTQHDSLNAISTLCTHAIFNSAAEYPHPIIHTLKGPDPQGLKVLALKTVYDDEWIEGSPIQKDAYSVNIERAWGGVLEVVPPQSLIELSYYFLFAEDPRLALASLRKPKNSEPNIYTLQVTDSSNSVVVRYHLRVHGAFFILPYAFLNSTRIQVSLASCCEGTATFHLATDELDQNRFPPFRPLFNRTPSLPAIGLLFRSKDDPHTVTWIYFEGINEAGHSGTNYNPPIDETPREYEARRRREAEKCEVVRRKLREYRDDYRLLFSGLALSGTSLMDSGGKAGAFESGVEVGASGDQVMQDASDLEGGEEDFGITPSRILGTLGANLSDDSIDDDTPQRNLAHHDDDGDIVLADSNDRLDSDTIILPDSQASGTIIPDSQASDTIIPDSDERYY